MGRDLTWGTGDTKQEAEAVHDERLHDDDFKVGRRIQLPETDGCHDYESLRARIRDEERMIDDFCFQHRDEWAREREEIVLLFSFLRQKLFETKHKFIYFSYV